jgi:hypothetical protein
MDWTIKPILISAMLRQHRQIPESSNPGQWRGHLEIQPLKIAGRRMEAVFPVKACLPDEILLLG